MGKPGLEDSGWTAGVEGVGASANCKRQKPVSLLETSKEDAPRPDTPL